MVTGLGNTKYEFGRHLSHLGYELGKPRDYVLGELRKHMGEARFQQYVKVASVRGGDAAQNQVYDFMTDMREANLLRSACPDATLDTSYYLYEKCLRRLTAGKRVIELACWTGGLASFIAERHPDCQVVGVDRAKRVIEVDRAHFDLPNLGFVEWDYRYAKPDDLEPADVLLCGMGINNNVGFGVHDKCDPGAVRQSPGYQREREEGLTYFRNWRQAARPGASLITVLRVMTFMRFVAFIDAAQETGWAPMLEEFTFVQVPSNREQIPSLLFTAEPSERLSEDEALSHWVRITVGKPEVAQVAGPVALGLFRVLSNKHVLAHREYRNEMGFTTTEELGVCGCFGYMFGQDTRPDYRLALTTVEQIHAVADGLNRKPAPMIASTLVSGLTSSITLDLPVVHLGALQI